MIPAMLLGCLMTLPAQTITLDFSRGSVVGDNRYWAVTDTYLDSLQADRANGGLFTLSGGKGRNVLVRFGDLHRFLPWQSKVTKATLYLSPSSSDKPQFVGIGRVKAGWGEGPMFTAAMGRTEPVLVRGAATWKHRRNGENGIGWQQAGASGPEDAEAIAGAKMEPADTEIAITGLAATVQQMRDRWYENFGFSLQFEGNCEFFSSQAKHGKPRLVVEYSLDSAIAGPDLSVQWIDRIPQLPKDGEEVTYRASVKNVGNGPAKPFAGQWIVAEKGGAKFPITKALAEGESTVVEYKKIYRAKSGDHRLSPLMFRVYPEGGDTDSTNDAVEIDEDAIPIAVEGAKDGGQGFVQTVNETYFGQSRFSFATDGVKERVRIVPNADDAFCTIAYKGQKSDFRELIQKLTGLKPVDNPQNVAFDGRTIPYSDPYAGVSGFGDTRYDGLIPPGIPMLYVPVASPLFDNLPIESTDLLSGTEVAAINAAIGRKTGRDGVVWDLPATVILRAVDMTGKPLDGAELGFFQVDGGKMPDAPTQTIVTKEGGTVLLENRDVSTEAANGEPLHQLKRNPFGQLKADGSNGTILVRASINGEIEWGWIKAWQLVDTYHRGNKAAAIIDIRFNAPSGPLDRTTNLAKGRLVTDSTESLPAKLAGLTDDDPSTEVALGAKKGDWLEIDLGRDRPIGEIRVLFKDAQMPEKFDIQTYATGQKAPEFDAWVKELSFNWSRQNWAVKEADGSLAIPYRGPLTRSRFIRIVNRSGGAGKIGEVKVVPLKVEG